jgi:hypothetical protein
MSTNQVQFCSAIVRAHFGPVVEVRGAQSHLSRMK